MLARIIPVLALLTISVFAEDPVFKGMRETISILTPVPEEKSAVIRALSAELLARYVKLVNGSHLSHFTPSLGSLWIETNGLKLTNVTGMPVTRADIANGTAESYLVTVDSEIYRTYDPKSLKWSNWYSGRNVYLPSAVRVELTTHGTWIASTQEFSRLVQFYPRGNPNIVPHGSAPAIVKSPATISAPVTMVRNSFQTTALSKVPPVSAAAMKPPASPQSGTRPASSAAVKLPGPLDEYMPFIIVVTIISATATNILKKPKNSRRPIRHAKRSPPLPRMSNCKQPQLFQDQDPDAAYRPQPPPLPAPVTTPGPDPMRLVQRRDHLMTPAEQAFFAVLDPIVRPTCMISSKVRLADLFDVRQGKGQQTAFNKICSKHVDFVLTDPETSRILCAIELDDSSHQRSDRIERDNFLNQLCATNRLPLLRIPFAWSYSAQELRAKLAAVGLSVSVAA